MFGSFSYSFSHSFSTQVETRRFAPLRRNLLPRSLLPLLNTMQNSETKVRMAGAHCCICKEGIDFEVDADNVAVNPTGFDPCSLGLVTNVFGPRSEQKEQWFYCHAECFRKTVDNRNIGILDPDMNTIGEFDEERLEETLDAASTTWEAL